MPAPGGGLFGGWALANTIRRSLRNYAELGPLGVSEARDLAMMLWQHVQEGGTFAGTVTVSVKQGSPGEVVLGEAIRAAMPSMEMLRFTSSGTEAAMSAIRLARGATGRSKIIKFEVCYHGHADALLVKAGSGLATFGHPTSAGVPAEVVQHTLVLEYNNTEQIEAAFAAHGDEIACVMIEPIAGNMNFVRAQVPFVKRIRELCDRHGALFVFDEVMTGFRVALGSAQSLYAQAIPGFQPDISVFGKVIGGGMPLAAFGASRKIMGMLAPLGPVYQAGTLSGNPLAMAAGIATLKLLKEEGFYTQIEEKSAYLEKGLLDAAKECALPTCFIRVGGMFCTYFQAGPVHSFADAAKSDTAAFGKFFRQLLDEGINIAPSQFEAGFMSIAHSRDDLDRTIEAARRAFRAV